MSEPTSSSPVASEPVHPHEVWIIQPLRRRLWIHIVLLLATFITTTAVGSRIQFNFEHQKPTFWLSDDSPPLFPLSSIVHPSELLPGLPFSLTLMFILLAHEMGHYLYACHYRVYATLPYFVPFPSLIGTLGAFIRIKGRISSFIPPRRPPDAHPGACLSALVASDCGRRLGWIVCHRFEPVTGRATRRRPHPVLGVASAASPGIDADRARIDHVGVLLLERVAGLGSCPGDDQQAPGGAAESRCLWPSTMGRVIWSADAPTNVHS